MPFPLSAEQKQTAFWLAVWAAFLFLLITPGPALTLLPAVLMVALRHLQRHYLSSSFYNA